MKINYIFDDEIKHIDLKNITYILGPNQSGKSFILNFLKDCFEGKNKDFTVNGCCVSKGEFEVIFLKDSDSFETQFKFAKTNIFKELIYNDILLKTNEKKILYEVNKIFNVIDDKVNKVLNYKINKNLNEKISFDIEIDNIDTIIDKFTNIYINDYLLHEDEIPRSVKRKLIYNLLFFRLDFIKDKSIIVLIDDFDLFLDRNNTIEIINKLSKKFNNCNMDIHFIMTTSNNIYDLIEDKRSIFHISKNKLYKSPNFNDIIEKAIFLANYNNDLDLVSDIKFNDYFLNNRNLISNEEIDNITKKFNDRYQYNIGNIFISKNVSLKNKQNYKTSENVIIYHSIIEKYIYELIIKELNSIDKN